MSRYASDSLCEPAPAATTEINSRTRDERVVNTAPPPAATNRSDTVAVNDTVRGAVLACASFAINVPAAVSGLCEIKRNTVCASPLFVTRAKAAVVASDKRYAPRPPLMFTVANVTAPVPTTPR